jgi:hypothetical protein
MKRFIMALMYPALLATTTLPTRAFAEEWIGLDEKPQSTQIGYNYSRGQDGSDSHQFTFDHAPDLDHSFNLQYSRNNTATDNGDFDYDDLSGQLNWQAGDEFRLGISYQYQGKSNELEIENIGLMASYAPLSYLFMFEYRSGNLDAYTRSNIGNAQVPDRFSSAIDSYHFSATWIQEDYDLFLNYQNYQYEKDLSTLNSSALLQALVKPGVLANSGLLLSSSTALGVTLYQDKQQLTLMLANVNYEVDNSDSNSLQMNWRSPLSGFSVIYSGAITDDSQDNLSFGIGFEWNV